VGVGGGFLEEEGVAAVVVVSSSLSSSEEGAPEPSFVLEDDFLRFFLGFARVVVAVVGLLFERTFSGTTTTGDLTDVACVVATEDPPLLAAAIVVVTSFITTSSFPPPSVDDFSFLGLAPSFFLSTFIFVESAVLFFGNSTYLFPSLSGSPPPGFVTFRLLCGSNLFVGIVAVVGGVAEDDGDAGVVLSRCLYFFGILNALPLGDDPLVVSTVALVLVLEETVEGRGDVVVVDDGDLLEEAFLLPSLLVLVLMLLLLVFGRGGCNDRGMERVESMRSA